MGNRVVHFEIHAQQPERAIQFYSAMFGWRFEQWDGPMPYWLISTGEAYQPGINGGLIKRQGAVAPGNPPLHAFVCTVAVDNIDTYLARALHLGGQIVQAKMPIHDVGWLGYAKDTEGNTFGMLEHDSAAI